MPERAEIEAARALLRAWDARELAHPEHPATHRQWAGWMNEAADRLRTVLDRVRDARGDDEGRVKIPPLCDRCGGDHYITEHDAPPARSPQGEDHEAGIRAMFRAYEDWQDGKVEDPFAHMADAYRAAYLSRVPPSRDGTVAVEDWRTIAVRLASLLRELHPQNPYYREKQAEALVAFDALAGESNEGGNQNDERRR
jgi:hypothetical protein